MAFTKVSPAGIGSTPGDGYRIGDSFLHSTGVEITNINATGILTAASLDISGAIDFDGHTELDNVNISGVSTFAGNIDANGDLDVDGQTNLDNVSVAGVVTFTNSPNAIQMNDNARVSFGTSLKTAITYNSSDSKTKIVNFNDTLQIGYRNTEIYHTNQARLTFDSGNTFSNVVNTSFSGANYNVVWIPSSDTFRFNDNAKLVLGTNGDASLYHNNANLLISNTTGNIDVTGNVVLNNDISVDGHSELDNVNISGVTTIGTGGGVTPHNSGWATNSRLNLYGSYGGGIAFNDSGNNGYVLYADSSGVNFHIKNAAVGGTPKSSIKCIKDAAVELYYNGTKMLETNIPSGHNGEVILGQKVHVKHTGSGNGQIFPSSGNMYLNAQDSKTSIVCVRDAGVHLAYNNNIKLETTNTGAVISGILTATSFSGDHIGITTFNNGDINGISFPLNVKNNNNDNDYDMGTGIKLQGGSSTEYYKWCAIVARGENAGAGGYSNTQALSFYTYDNAGASGGTEKLRITSKGLLLGGSDAQGNTTLGNNAGDSFSGTSALQNTLIGDEAGTAITSGDQSVALGFRALKTLSSNGGCVAIGAYALEDNTAGGNTAIGYNSMKENASGANNTAIGFDALVNNTGNLNIAIGRDAMKASNHNAGHDNVVLGSYAASQALHMYRNVIIGRSAIDQSTSNNSIHSNVIIGYEAGRRLNYYIAHNVILGAHAMDGGGTGGGLANQYNISDNIAIGRYALQNVKHTSNNNIVLGQEAAQNAGTGSGTYSNWTHNIAIGQRCLRDATGGSDNLVAVGHNALEYHTGDGDGSSGGYTVAFGNSAFRNNRHIRHSVALGNSAGSDWNPAKGAMHEGSCTFIGGGAGRTCSTGTALIAVGRDALSGGGPCTGVHNTAIGSRCFERITSGSNNCAVGGLYTGLMLTTGDYNNFFGSLAGYAYNVNTGATGDHNNIFGGYSAASGNNDHENIFGGGLTGKGANTTFIRGPVYNSPNTSSFSTTSDERIKKNIVDNNIGLDAIEKIRVRNFEYRTKDEITDFDYADAVVVEKEGVQLGVIAQEIKEILPDVVKQNTTGAYAVDPDNLTWYLVNAVKELSAEVKSLKAQLNS